MPLSEHITALLRKARLLSMIFFMGLVWLLFFMVYFERFVPPFDRLIPLLMPWKMLYAIPAELMEDRMSFMQRLLDLSNKVSNFSFFMMTISFIAFSAYLTFLYQQRQRRTNENRLLFIKNQEIARRNEFIRYISATISHEFKNNLGRIKRRLDLLAGLPPETMEHINNNMDRLFADIDIFKRISDEREQSLVHFDKIDLKTMCEDLAGQYADLADISIIYKVYPPPIYASVALLKTVFENLFDNSIKHKKPEQVRAHIILSFSLDIDVRRSYVSLSFRDEGIGMEEEKADRCFYKGKKTESGWGQGLYFVKYVVGLHAGKIRIGKDYTALDTGTEIIVNLPFVEESIDV
jgi:signal transduction histidine kinase